MAMKYYTRMTGYARQSTIDFIIFIQQADSSPQSIQSFHELHRMGIPCMRCVSHTGYLVHGNSKSELRGRSRHNNKSKRVVKNLKERILTLLGGKVPKKVSLRDMSLSTINQTNPLTRAGKRSFYKHRLLFLNPTHCFFGFY